MNASSPRCLALWPFDLALSSIGHYPLTTLAPTVLEVCLLRHKLLLPFFVRLLEGPPCDPQLQRSSRLLICPKTVYLRTLYLGSSTLPLLLVLRHDAFQRFDHP